MSLTVEEPGVTSWYLRPVAMCAIATANLLARLSPWKLRRVLQVLARRARPSTAEEASRARNAVTAVSARCRGNWCLQRSIATVLMSRLAGHWPDWYTGVRLAPFAAHAWVEADGKPVDEAPNLRDVFSITMGVPAGGRNRA
jgi:hypothetical protein